mmetsp:Transcript_44548/g.71614  ORF Transcript_44548/g.71614 Transcript_44548/m.71614 type:complete len:302 (-) Transcript_44548:1467-2372(-)
MLREGAHFVLFGLPPRAFQCLLLCLFLSLACHFLGLQLFRGRILRFMRALALFQQRVQSRQLLLAHRLTFFHIVLLLLHLLYFRLELGGRFILRRLVSFEAFNLLHEFALLFLARLFLGRHQIELSLHLEVCFGPLFLIGKQFFERLVLQAFLFLLRLALFAQFSHGLTLPSLALLSISHLRLHSILCFLQQCPLFPRMLALNLLLLLEHPQLLLQFHRPTLERLRTRLEQCNGRRIPRQPLGACILCLENLGHEAPRFFLRQLRFLKFASHRCRLLLVLAHRALGALCCLALLHDLFAQC